MSEEIKYCDKAIAEALKFYEENYNLIVIPVPERETYIDTTNEYVCRFCGKNLTQTTFKMKAHAIPEFMGNKNLLSKNECDLCNREFGQNYEDHLARMLLPVNSFTQVKGKNGIPTYKSEDKKIKIKTINKRMVISHSNSEKIKIDKKNKIISIEFASQRFIPIKAYSAFLKMALSIMPENELIFFEPCINYLKGRLKGKIKLFPFVLTTFTNGYKPYKQVINYLCIRKNENYNIPYMLYILATGNYMYQIIVPSVEKDKLNHNEKKQYTIKPFPSPYSIGSSIKEIRKSEYELIDFHSNQLTTIKKAYAGTYQVESQNMNL